MRQSTSLASPAAIATTPAAIEMCCQNSLMPSTRSLLPVDRLPPGVPLAVPADRRDERALRPLELAHPLAHGDEAFGGRAHLLEGAVSLDGSEETIGHGAGTS